jgi:hypothetical protein
MPEMPRQNPLEHLKNEGQEDKTGPVQGSILVE